MSTDFDPLAHMSSAAAERLRQSVIDRRPCPACGGDRLRQDFTGSGRCHVPQKPEPTELPVWRHDPEPECEHGATVTGHAALWSHDGHGDVDIVATTAVPITLCLVCHRLAPTPQEDPQP